ncbi:hypothetical protein E4T50_15740 [Aureobasidium sp. EXF-12298]|nr:hypothetical protein E4T50_15740 [Aureobasidium sp. EXF-12298]KAI4769854.1 hypothetical protein E4T52_15108 [Aureobasidium sp. EXF-3400]
MAKGSCACGEVKFEYQGEPAGKGACHCIPCRKTSGTTNSYNLMIPSDKYKILSGSLRTWTRKGDTGKGVTYNYCQNCPTILYVTGEAIQGINIVKMGTLDDQEDIEKLGKPGLELYTKNRPQWCDAIPGAQQMEAGRSS